MRVHKVSDKPGYIAFWCFGCRTRHSLKVAGNSKPRWDFNLNFDRPTLTPSVKVTAPPLNFCCHSFITDGKIQYLSDCTHKYAGKTVDLAEIEEYKSYVDT